MVYKTYDFCQKKLLAKIGEYPLSTPGAKHKQKKSFVCNCLCSGLDQSKSNQIITYTYILIFKIN